MSAFGETLTLHSRSVTGQDQDGNDLYGDTLETSPGWAVAPRNSSELVQGRDTTIIGVSAVLLGTIPLTAVDRVTITTGPYAGAYEIDGLPGFYIHPMTGTEATELHLTRIAG